MQKVQRQLLCHQFVPFWIFSSIILLLFETANNGDCKNNLGNDKNLIWGTVRKKFRETRAQFWSEPEARDPPCIASFITGMQGLGNWGGVVVIFFCHKSGGWIFTALGMGLSGQISKLFLQALGPPLYNVACQGTGVSSKTHLLSVRTTQPNPLALQVDCSMICIRLTVSSRGKTFLPIFVTLWDAQN